MSTANQIQYKHSGATDIVSCDLGENLATGETITAVSVSNATLTLGTPAVNNSAIEILGRSVPAGEAVQFSVAGGVAGTDYTITVTYDTSAGRSNLVLYCCVVVV